MLGAGESKGDERGSDFQTLSVNSGLFKKGKKISMHPIRQNKTLEKKIAYLVIVTNYDLGSLCKTHASSIRERCSEQLQHTKDCKWKINIQNTWIDVGKEQKGRKSFLFLFSDFLQVLALCN